MADTATAPAEATPAPAATTVKPWYDGKADADIIGHWENKGWKKDDPADIAITATKAYREAEKFLGAPKDELIRMPKPTAPENEIKAFWQKLGAPPDAKGYDFAGIKFADGKELDPKFVDALRDAASRVHLPKDAAAEVARAVVKHMESDDAEKNAQATAKLSEEKAELAKNWGTNFEANKFIAAQGAKVLGITPEQITALEGVIGYKGVMEAMHRVGILNKEDRFIAPGGGTQPGIMTRDAAISRRTELMQDQAWVARYTNGDAAARREMLNINRIITGDFESAA